jgi:hypothetical protein
MNGRNVKKKKYFEHICVHFVGTVMKHFRLTQRLWTTQTVTIVRFNTGKYYRLRTFLSELTFRTKTNKGASLHVPFTPTQNITQARKS